MTAPGPWWCEAYGPPRDGVPAADWPRCFLALDPAGRACATPDECATTMAAERGRVFTRINELAADGDNAMRYLAEHFPTPADLLDGRDEEGPRTH